MRFKWKIGDSVVPAVFKRQGEVRAFLHEHCAMVIYNKLLFPNIRVRATQHI